MNVKKKKKNYYSQYFLAVLYVGVLSRPVISNSLRSHEL